MTDFSKIPEYTIASDVSAERDGIGIEIYQDNQLLLEVFRDDRKKRREVTLYQPALDLELVEQAIALFKQEIPWDFQE
jgi:hypothetical protein